MRTFQLEVKFILVHCDESLSTFPVDLVYTRWAALVRVKAAESQRPNGAPMQAETIYYFSVEAPRPRQPPRTAGAALAGGLDPAAACSAAAAASESAGPGSAGASSSSSPAVESCYTTSTAFQCSGAPKVAFLLNFQYAVKWQQTGKMYHKPDPFVCH